ncbi:guanylyl cyclase-activating protein 3 isoform X2 [Falco biarmicus]|uniref:guanylyl cyclase-activating protein 3 isoform X2 n=1 Tax=Falco peregrinus TaxID=8954 RepID=UPI000386F566|nr:guanylyl cyclase-activating protein 3 isoform X2 [Falco peregrinus]XP_056185904.1 guanylyl cyclase-activating protein 3 isoform X2 [Falco biarmicus]
MGAGESADDFAATENSQWYRKFMDHCPSGQLSLYEFKTILGLHGMNPQANTYIERVFHTFDKNQDGFIDFLEFIAAINLVIRGKIDQKLKWYFKLYDADGNGCIDKKELISIFTAIQAINGHSNMSAEDFTNMVFQKIDVNNDGELTLEEFINGVEGDEGLMELITKNFDLSNVLKVIQNGRRHSV